jgi:hypothetical protein
VLGEAGFEPRTAAWQSVAPRWATSSAWIPADSLRLWACGTGFASDRLPAHGELSFS